MWGQAQEVIRSFRPADVSGPLQKDVAKCHVFLFYEPRCIAACAFSKECGTERIGSAEEISARKQDSASGASFLPFAADEIFAKSQRERQEAPIYSKKHLGNTRTGISPYCRSSIPEASIDARHMRFVPSKHIAHIYHGVLLIHQEHIYLQHLSQLLLIK